MNNLSDSLAVAFSITDMLDLVLTLGVVSPYTAELSNHFLLTFQVAACCPRDDRQATYRCWCSTHATIADMAEKLPPILATLSGSGDEGVSLTSTLPHLQRSPIMLTSVKKLLKVLKNC